MMLYVNGQDIRRLTLAYTNDGGVALFQTYDAAPEDFLACVDKFLKSASISLNNINRIVAVTGPGSATSLRTVLSIVNTIGMARNIPLAGAQKQPEEADREFVERLLAGEASSVPGVPFLAPHYAHGPRITEARKDRLGRKI